MKISFESHQTEPGESRTDTLSTRPKTAAENHAEIIRRGVKARAAEIERELMACLERTTRPADENAVAVALMRMAVNRHIEIMGEAPAFEHLRKMFDRSV